MIVLQYVIFFYSSGMPILYLFGFAAFLASYLFDKWYLFNFYRKPSTFDESLVQELKKMSNFTVPIHFIGGIILLQNPSIIPSKGYEGHVQAGISLKMLGQEHMLIFIIYHVVLLAAFFLAKPLKEFCMQKFQKKKTHPESTPDASKDRNTTTTTSDDFYMECNLDFLVGEYKRTKLEQKEILESSIGGLIKTISGASPTSGVSPDYKTQKSKRPGRQMTRL